MMGSIHESVEPPGLTKQKLSRSESQLLGFSTLNKTVQLHRLCTFKETALVVLMNINQNP